MTDNKIHPILATKQPYAIEKANSHYIYTINFSRELDSEKMKLINAAARTTVLAKYLQKFRQHVGNEKYLQSLIRREHGTGSGFAKVSNTGSRDCLKESIRGITDALNLKYNTPKALIFRTDSCRALTVFDKTIHRIEHTIEVRDLYLELEYKFILADEPIYLDKIGVWVVQNQITTWIEKHEQRGRREYDHAKPFAKYKSNVFLNDRDVSDLSRLDITDLTSHHFFKEIEILEGVKSNGALDKMTASFDGADAAPHTLPPLELAVEAYNDDFKLLTEHYRHKLKKLTQSGSSWYSEHESTRYAAWLDQQVKTTTK
jgi:hypothetical protein